jgi:hypothetical protein
MRAAESCKPRNAAICGAVLTAGRNMHARKGEALAPQKRNVKVGNANGQKMNVKLGNVIAKKGCLGTCN